MTGPSCDTTDPAAARRRRTLSAATCIVLKVGTNVLLDREGALDMAVLAELAASVARCRHGGREIVLVCSGAIGAGAHGLGLDGSHQRAACAAAGQSLITARVHDALGRHAVAAAQLLVTSEDFLDADRTAGLRDTLRHLLQAGIVPLLNENDAVSLHAAADAPRAFHDNDQLAALLTGLLSAQLLVLLTDVDGLYTHHPSHPDAVLIAELNALTAWHMAHAGPAAGRGRGGMRSKLAAVESALTDPAAYPGLAAIIANGRRPGVFDRILAGEPVGTLIGGGAAEDNR